MPGTGKSTVGVILAKRLGYDFLDTDLLMIRKAGKTLPELLAETSVASFLELENQVGTTLCCEKCVIATGGSMVLCETAMANLRNRATVIWLDTDLAEIERRVVDSDRGIAVEPGTTLAEVFWQRQPLYQKYADLHIVCADGTDNVVAQIRTELQI